MQTCQYKTSSWKYKIFPLFYLYNFKIQSLSYISNLHEIYTACYFFISQTHSSYQRACNFPERLRIDNAFPESEHETFMSGVSHSFHEKRNTRNRRFISANPVTNFRWIPNHLGRGNPLNNERNPDAYPVWDVCIQRRLYGF